MVEEPVDPGYCLFLAERMLGLLPQLRDEIEGVREGTEIEAVHRMRVASRRLRAVLPLYAGCAGRKEFRRWRREIRSVTRALGAARDADVQLEFLASYAASLTGSVEDGAAPAPEPAAAPLERLARFPRLLAAIRRARGSAFGRRDGEWAPASPAAPAAPGQEGIERLLLRLGQRRAALQPDVIEALDHLERSGVLNTMGERLRSRAVRARLAGVPARSAPAYAAAHLNAALRYHELAAHAAALRDPSRAAEHHAMRIAAKRLRYTLETFAPLYDDELKGELKAMKRLQEALGQLHDCDVWIVELPRFLEDERARAIAYYGHDGFFHRVEPGIRRLLSERQIARVQLHAAALAIWEGLVRDGFFERLLHRLAQARDEAMLPPDPLRSIADADATAQIALIADIHGNLPALEAVIRDAEAHGVHAFIGAGDLSTDGADTGAVARRLAALGSVDIRGEADRRAIRAALRADADPDVDPMDPAGLAYLEGLPSERRFALRGTRFLVVHRYPRRGKERLGPGMEDADLAQLAGSVDADVVIVGHTHRQFVRVSRGVRFINPGSVGRADAGIGLRAEYALLQLSPFDLSFHAVPYGGADVDYPASAPIEAPGDSV